MPSQAEEAALHQDVAAERMLPAARLAVQAAQAGAAVPPETFEAVVKTGVFAALVALVAMNFRRKPEGPRPSGVELEAQADRLTPKVSDAMWGAAKEHAVTNHMDQRFVLDLARGAGTMVSSEATMTVSDLMGWPYKVWITRGDEKVRASHRALHGRAVEVGNPFKRWPDGQVLDFPGDRRAPIGEWISCRCFLFASPTKAAVAEALAPADLDKAFALAASLEQRWYSDG